MSFKSMSHSERKSGTVFYRGRFPSADVGSGRRPTAEDSESVPEEASASLDGSGSSAEESSDGEDEQRRLMDNAEGSPTSIQIPVPTHRGSTGAVPRMGRRFTLNPLIFAKVTPENMNASMISSKHWRFRKSEKLGGNRWPS